MKLTQSIWIAALAAALLTAAPAHSDDHPSTSDKKPAAAKELPSAKNDIVAVASKADGFQTLVKAVQAAGLVETLQGEGPFTVFAPTDEAFAKLPKGMLESLLKPESKDELASILTFHVVPGKVMASDVKTMKAKSANGQELNIQVDKDGVTIEKAKVIKTDIIASNGVIHVIDSVMLPAAPAKEAAKKSKPKDHPGH